MIFIGESDLKFRVNHDRAYILTNRLGRCASGGAMCWRCKHATRLSDAQGSRLWKIQKNTSDRRCSLSSVDET